MSPIMQPIRQRAWLWLVAGALLLPFVTFQTILPLAAWLSPVLLLRFARTRRALVGLPILALVHYVATVAALRNILPMPMLLIYGLGGITNVLTYAADLVLARRLKGWARTLVFPATAVVLDWWSGLSSLGTVGSVAYSQWGSLPLNQLVSITGIWGLVFLINWLAPVLNELWEHGFNRATVRYSFAPIAIVLLATLLGGSMRLAFFPPSGQTVRVASLAADRALSQGPHTAVGATLASGSTEMRASTRAEYAPIVDELFSRTRQQAQAGAKIVVWSEAAAYALKEDEPALIARAQAVAREGGLYLQISVVFALRTEQFPYAENRTILLDPEGNVVWDYFKAIHPLGEATIFAPGPGIIPTVQTPYGRLTTVICFDADFPALIQQAGQARADILLVPANDWRPVDTLHARVATFRAIENGVAMVRPTGNGRTIAVDHVGQVLATADYFTTDRLTMVADVPTRGVPTIYARIGDSFVYLSILGLVALAGAALLQRRSMKLPVALPT